MLILTCNLAEVLRLRNTLIIALEQAHVLEDIYNSQMKLMSKEGTSRFKDPFNFQNYIANNGENFVNFIDEGPADDIKIELAVNEFDPKLRNCMNFTDSECVKALMLPIGLEEMRAVV